MRNWTYSPFPRGGALVAVLALAISPLSAQAPAAARAAGRTPNLNGIWQAINSANYNLEGHAAEASPVKAARSRIFPPLQPSAKKITLTA
jgi:hypothetical protein